MFEGVQGVSVFRNECLKECVFEGVSVLRRACAKE